MQYKRTKNKVTIICRTYRGTEKNTVCVYVNEDGQEFIKTKKMCTYVTEDGQEIIKTEPDYAPLKSYENHFSIVVLRH